MSCIVSVCYSDYCTIMGDGRLLNFTEKFPRVESETFRKVIKFNSYVCMGGYRRSFACCKGRF